MKWNRIPFYLRSHLLSHVNPSIWRLSPIGHESYHIQTWKSWSACHLHFVAKIEYMKKALTLKHGSCIFDGEELDQVDHKCALCRVAVPRFQLTHHSWELGLWKISRKELRGITVSHGMRELGKWRRRLTLVNGMDTIESVSHFAEVQMVVSKYRGREVPIVTSICKCQHGIILSSNEREAWSTCVSRHYSWCDNNRICGFKTTVTAICSLNDSRKENVGGITDKGDWRRL